MTPSDIKNTVLIVEDDQNTASLVAAYLEKEGFAAVVAGDGEEGLRQARRQHPVLVVLDLMLPGVDGWDVCRELRRTSDVPILMLTAREDEIDRIMGLSLGADDYVVKPFSPRELVERVKAILRRTMPGRSRSGVILSRSGLLIDTEKHSVTLDGRLVSLTLTEYKLLHTLMKAPGRVFSRKELLQQLYEHDEAVVERVIDVHIGKIRQKIETDPSAPRYIQTVRGIGYRFADHDGV